MIQQDFDLCKFLAKSNPSIALLDIHIVTDHAKKPNDEFVVQALQRNNKKVVDPRWGERIRRRSSFSTATKPSPPLQQQRNHVRSSSTSAMEKDKPSATTRTKISQTKTRPTNRRKTYPIIDRRWDNASPPASSSSSSSSSSSEQNYNKTGNERLVCPIRR